MILMNDKFVNEFELTGIGKALKINGYKIVDRDFDDNTLKVVYRKGN